MKYICTACEDPCHIDTGSKLREHPGLCPWPNVANHSNWVPVREQQPKGKSSYRVTFSDVTEAYITGLHKRW